MKVGDQVRLIARNPACGMGMTHYGDVGTLVHFDENSKEVNIDFPRHESWYGYAKEVQLISYSDNYSATILLETRHPFDKPIEVSADYEDVGLPF